MSRKDDPRSRKSAEDPPRREEAKGAARPRPVEFGGRRNGLEPTRYGDWEKDGRCIDF